MLKEVTNSYVLHCLEIQRFAHISGTRFRIVMLFGSKRWILNGQVDYIENLFPLIMSQFIPNFQQLKVASLVAPRPVTVQMETPPVIRPRV